LDNAKLERADLSDFIVKDDVSPAIDLDSVWEALREAARAPHPIAALETALGIVIDDGDKDFPTWKSRQTFSAPVSQMIDLYLPLVIHDTSDHPMRIAHLGQSLDGRIATVIGASHYVTGPENIDHLHRLRALCDAVVVGAGTAEADNPRLTVRRVAGENPLRVVIDPRGRLSPTLGIFNDCAAKTLIYRAKPVPAKQAAQFSENVEIAVMPKEDDGISPGAIIDDLRQRGAKRIFVEGGGVTVSRFLRAGCLDRLQVTIAPMVIGSGRSGISLPEIDRLDRAIRPRARHFSMGSDILFDCAPGTSVFP